MGRWVLVFSLVCGAVFAHDIEHYPDTPKWMLDWYRTLTNQKGGNCCSMADALAITTDDWEIGGIGYRVRVEGVWFDVPPEAIVNGPNKAGTAVVWPVTSQGITLIRCFLPGAGG